jgi:hypothetical protein
MGTPGRIRHPSGVWLFWVPRLEGCATRLEPLRLTLGYNLLYLRGAEPSLPVRHPLRGFGCFGRLDPRVPRDRSTLGYKSVALSGARVDRSGFSGFPRISQGSATRLWPLRLTLGYNLLSLPEWKPDYASVTPAGFWLFRVLRPQGSA